MTLFLFLYFIIPIIMAVVIVLIKFRRDGCVILHWEDCDVVVHRTVARRFKN